MVSQGTIVKCPHCDTKNRVTATSSGVPRCSVCHTLLPWIVDATPESFEQETTASVPVLVDFWAPWCGPCRTMAPIFDKAAKELEPRARFAKVNVDEEPTIAARFGIRGIPTLIAFEKGKVAKQHAGLVDLNFLKGLARTS